MTVKKKGSPWAPFPKYLCGGFLCPVDGGAFPLPRCDLYDRGKSRPVESTRLVKPIKINSNLCMNCTDFVFDCPHSRYSHDMSVPSSTTVIDPKALESYRALGEAFLRELIEIFLESGRTQMVRVSAYLATGDLQGVRREAHGLKAASATVGAVEVHRLCREIEFYEPVASHSEHYAQFANELASEFARASDSLRRRI